MRVKIIRTHDYHRVGDVLVLDRKAASDLIKRGIAVISKDMAPDDYKQAGDKYGKFTKLRTNHRSGR